MIPKYKPFSLNTSRLFILLLIVNYINFGYCQDAVISSNNIPMSDGLKRNAETTCVVSGKCGQSEVGPIPCAQKTSPTRFTKKEDIELLNHLCPTLKDQPVCCDPDQVSDMNDNMQAMASFKTCAPCYKNFVEIFCQSTCNQNQSSFITVLKSEPADDDVKKLKATKISYSMKLSDAEQFYNSCSKAYSTEFVMTLPVFFSGSENGAELVSNIGKMSGLFEFYLIDGNNTFIISDKSRIDVDPVTERSVEIQFKNCNETSNNQPCRCSQCEILPCPHIPGIQEPVTCTILNLFTCSSVVIMIIYSLLLITSIVFFVTYLRRKKTRNQENEGEVREDDKETSTIDNVTEASESRMEKLIAQFFESWTRFCVRHPYIVILVGVLSVCSLSFGLLNFTVISDPVELWSSPNSVARQQREFFNTKFKPFFRVQQIIIKNTDNERSLNDSDFTNLFNYDFLLEQFELQNQITSLTAEYENETVTLEDVCYQPLSNNKCAIQSPFAWFQEDIEKFDRGDYLDQFKECFQNYFTKQECFGTYGGPAFPYVALGGYDDQKYNKATSFIISIMLNNHAEEQNNHKAMAWEKVYLDFMEHYIKNQTKNSTSQISYYSERSVGDELERQSLSDVGTIAISYITMFLYVSTALSQFAYGREFLVGSKISLAIVGVLIVLASVTSSVAFLSLCGLRATLIIVEVIPFLVLAVGVDNIFIIVQSLKREKEHKDSIEEKMAKVMSKVGPSLLLAFLSEVSCFFLGAISSMPCIRIFALNAALALIFDFILQMTVFVAFLSLDEKRRNDSRYDILVCIKSKKSNSTDEMNSNNSMPFDFFKNFASFLMRDMVRFLVLVIFSIFLCIACIVIKDVDVGLDQELSMPKDSYVNHYFQSQKSELRVGPPMYFVVKNSLDYSKVENRKFFADYIDLSLANIVKTKSVQNNSYIATGVSNWMDAYDSWAFNSKCFQVYRKDGKTFCGANVQDRGKHCFVNENLIDTSLENAPFVTMKTEYYYDYIEDFLNDVPSKDCPFGGHAQFKDSILLNKGDNSTKTVISTSYFMAYHSVLRTSQDFVNAFEDAKITSDYIRSQILAQTQSSADSSIREVEIFPYSIIYVFYDQFLTIWRDSIFNLSLSLLAISIVTYILIGFDLRNTLIVIFTLLSILFNIFSAMYWWNISLNAVSLVNLVMSVGISIEFCSHILHNYCTNNKSTSKLRAQNALAQIGSSVFSGIALTKFAGIIVLANSKSQIFQVFYFRMYLIIVIVGATHGLILLPVLLSLFGSKARRKVL